MIESGEQSVIPTTASVWAVSTASESRSRASLTAIFAMRAIVQDLYQLVHITGHDRAGGSRTAPIVRAKVQLRDSGGGDGTLFEPFSRLIPALQEGWSSD